MRQGTEGGLQVFNCLDEGHHFIEGIYIINLKRTWEKLLMAARAIVAIENLANVSVISSRNNGQRALLKFAAPGATPIAGRFTPGTFTNQIQAACWELRLLVVTDPKADHQPFTEASYVNLPTIALCNTDSPLHYVDIAIPCNNKGAHSVGLMWWMLAREVLRMRGTISREHPWEVMPDLYFYRDPEEIEKEEQATAEKAVTKEEFQGEWTAPPPEFTATQPEVAGWSEGTQVPLMPLQQFPTEDWSAQPATEDWSAAPTAQATEWVGKPLSGLKLLFHKGKQNGNSLKNVSMNNAERQAKGQEISKEAVTTPHSSLALGPAKVEKMQWGLMGKVSTVGLPDGDGRPSPDPAAVISGLGHLQSQDHRTEETLTIEDLLRTSRSLIRESSASHNCPITLSSFFSSVSEECFSDFPYHKEAQASVKINVAHLISHKDVAPHWILQDNGKTWTFPSYHIQNFIDLIRDTTKIKLEPGTELVLTGNQLYNFTRTSGSIV
ncbi:uncharacterized protein LOC114217453 [Eumetopias jubatus]|uniref:uncharacterized protein LOC114217453 n=1 Tax=Eumetopias jubatus TaxID=34886 RepID=UPI0010170631|nr:uncharacterized protein LOC114217453 [Eumetopias jubatus]